MEVKFTGGKERHNLYIRIFLYYCLWGQDSRGKFMYTYMTLSHVFKNNFRFAGSTCHHLGD